MNPLSQRSAAAVVSVVGFLAFGATAAMAGNSISIQVGGDPTEEVPLPIPVTWSSTSSEYVLVTVQPAGGQGCGANYDADDPNSSDVIDTTGASGTSSENWTFQDPGAFSLCGYLQHSVSDSTPLEATGPVRVNVRSATASRRWRAADVRDRLRRVLLRSISAGGRRARQDPAARRCRART
jgi:hypothetical protein